MSFTSFFHLLWTSCFNLETTPEKSALLHNFKKCEIYVNTEKITLDLALSKTEQELGLSFRKSIDNNEGMLFLSQKNIPLTFHSKKILFDVCIVFLDEKNIVISSKILRPNDEITTPNDTFYILELSPLYCSNIQKEQSISLCEGEWN